MYDCFTRLYLAQGMIFSKLSMICFFLGPREQKKPGKGYQEFFFGTGLWYD